jgi:uncharacterized protein (TIGR01777 family)
MRIAITGAAGLIGGALVPHLRAEGHDVVRLVRRRPLAADEVQWDPSGDASGAVDRERLAGLDAVVHLAGAGIGDRRWTDAHKRKIRESRVVGTETISRAMAELDPRPKALVTASAVGWYGITGDQIVDETHPPGSGFLAEVCREWEQAADPARDAGIRVAQARSGVVVAGTGGAFGRMMPLFRLGLGGRLGSGRQWWSLISLEDELRALTFLVEQEGLAGGVNLTATSATNAEITRALGRALRRPTVFPVPAPVLRTVLGELSSEVLESVRVDSRRLREAGFVFRHPDVESIMRTITGRPAG